MRKLVLILIVVAVVLLVWKGPWPQGDTDLLFEKVWIDRVAVKPKSFVRMFIFWEDGVALTINGSAYRAHFDVFEFDHRGEFEVRYLQDDVVETWKVKTWRCNAGEAPDPDFVYCMSLERKGVTTKYFATDEDDDAAARKNALRTMIDVPQGRSGIMPTL